MAALNDLGESATADSAPTAPVASTLATVTGGGGWSLAYLLPPAVTGTAQVGATLSATAGKWNTSILSIAYQWQICTASDTGCVNIAGANGAQLGGPQSAAGATVRVVVTGSVGATSVPVAPTRPASSRPAR